MLADLNYYVNLSTGSDSNDGLTSGTAFATSQHAWTKAATWDLNNHNIGIHFAAGTDTVGIQSSLGPIGSGTTYLIGSGSGTSSIATTSNICVQINAACWVSVQGFTLSSSAAHCLLASAPGALIQLNGDIIFGTTAGYHMYAASQARISCVQNYSIHGGAFAHTYAEQGANVVVTNNTVTITASITFGGAFAYANTVGQIVGGATTYSLGAFTVTCPRYASVANAVISVGGSATYYPGNAAGTTSTGGQYV